MDKDKRDKAWAFAWLSFGVGAVITMIAAPGLPFWSLFILTVFAGVSLSLAAHYFGWVTLHISTDEPKKTYGLLALIWFGVVLFIYAQIPKESLVLYYKGMKLDGQNIELQPCDISKLEICLDSQNGPDYFVLQGIGMFADKAVEAHDVLLAFSPAAGYRDISYPRWLSDSSDGTGFSLFLDREIIPTRLLVRVPSFLGMRLPNAPLRVTISVYYGTTSTHATFTVKKPT
jgi:hypothetical protein